MAELVDAHVSGACIARCAGSSPVPGTKEILQVVLNERKSKIFFLLYPKFGHILDDLLVIMLELLSSGKCQIKQYQTIRNNDE